MVKKIILILLIITAVLLRFWNIEGRTNYGFDQSRDLVMLETYISTRQLPLLGPIVRGDIGGFYLGPLYHYLLIPLYQLSNYDPLVLVYLSVILDILVAVALTTIISPSAGIIWVFSSLLINSSLTPWNVSLIHPWILLSLYLLNKLTVKPSAVFALLFCFVIGVVTSIHLTLWPLAFIYFLLALPHLWRATKSRIGRLLFIFALVLPQTPLILSDLNRGGTNLRAFKDFLFVQSTNNTVTLSAFASTFINKLGFTISRLFLGEPYLGLGLMLVVLILCYGFFHAKSNIYIRYSLFTIIVIFLSLFLYRDLDFAEYYLNGALIPFIIIFAYFLNSFQKTWVTVVVLLLLIASNYRSLNFATGPYSLLNKRQLIEKVVPLAGKGVDLRLLLNESQQFGFAYYLTQFKIAVGSQYRLKLYVTPSDLVHVPAPADAPSIIYQAKQNAFQVIVFSN